MKTIAIVSGKGGAGKTTVATNIAVYAVEDGKTVVVVDLDPQPSAYGWFRARAQQTGLVVLPTHHAALPQLISDSARDKIDLVIIDTPPTTEGGAPKAACDHADVTIIPCQPCAHDLRAIQDTLELCRGRGVTPFVVLNEVEANSPLTEEARVALKEMGVRVLPQMVSRARAFKHTATDGRGITEFDKRGKAAEDIRALYRAILKLQSKK